MARKLLDPPHRFRIGRGSLQGVCGGYMKFSSSLGFSLFLLLSILSGCSKAPVSQMPEIRGPAIDAGAIKEGDSEFIDLGNGAEIVVEKRGGILYTQIEGTFA